MKASELIAELNAGVTCDGSVSGVEEIMREAATMLERILALADELEAEARRTRSLIRSAAMTDAAKRIRRIAGEELK